MTVRTIGVIAVRGEPRADAASGIAALRAMGVSTVMLSGDNARTANAIGTTLDIEVTVDLIGRLKQSGRVAMVGDGINDGPALVTADLGLAIGRGTDVAIAAADVILVRDDLRSVPQALDLARATMRTIRTNLVWAFGYNVAAIPIAAAGLLNPLIAGAAMAFSSFFVVSNSLRLRNFGRVTTAPEG